MLEMDLVRKWKGGIWLAGYEDLNFESSEMDVMLTATGRHWMMVLLRGEERVVA